MGELFINGEKFCDTLEPCRTHHNHPCIPAGKYQIGNHYSMRFHGIRPLVMNVPGRANILIHEGNKPEDTLGCILLGTYYKQDFITNSRNALIIFKNKIADEIKSDKRLFINIVD